MPRLRYKYWESDPTGIRKAIVGNREYVFTREQQGIAVVPKDDAMTLLRTMTHYDVAQWCDRCEADVPPPTVPGPNLPSTPAPVTPPGPAVVEKKRGRPRKR